MARFRRTVLATVTAAFTIVGSGVVAIESLSKPSADRPTEGHEIHGTTPTDGVSARNALSGSGQLRR